MRPSVGGSGLVPIGSAPFRLGEFPSVVARGGGRTAYLASSSLSNKAGAIATNRPFHDIIVDTALVEGSVR
jgi:hypothetical protein